MLQIRKYQAQAVEQAAHQGSTVCALGGLRDQTGLYRAATFEEEVGLKSSRDSFQPELTCNWET